jgi:uncharacterized protein (TIGR02145 family)
MKQLSWIVLLLTISTFSQTLGGGVTDIDGNQYNSVIIGTQEWTKENLNVSKYTDGTIIPQVTDPIAWGNLTTGAWCYYNNDPANGAIYGKLYNWYAVAGIHDTDPNTPNKTLAPTGWQVPTDGEFTILTTFLGGLSVAGGKMKSTGTSLWNPPNTESTNESGFTGHPAGYRIFAGGFRQIKNYCGFWSSSVLATTGSAWLHYLSWGTVVAYRNYESKYSGYSVRCIKNNILSNLIFETNTLILYPNPVVSVLNIKADNNLINQPYSIIDGLGRIVLNGKLNEVDTTINVEQLSKGIYYLKVSGNSANKFIKE